MDFKLLSVVAYFATLLVSGAIAGKRAFQTYRSRPSWAVVYLLCAAAALVLTWTEIIYFLRADFEATSPEGDIVQWLHKSEILVKAYEAVCDTASKYWWSQQLLSFVVTFVIFLLAEGQVASFTWMERCAYVWLAFGGAVSLAYPLILHHLIPTNVPVQARKSNEVASLAERMAVFVAPLFVISMIGLASPLPMLLPFDGALFLIHAVLFIPNALPDVVLHALTADVVHPAQPDRKRLGRLYLWIAVVCFALHLWATLRLTDFELDVTSFAVLFNDGFTGHANRGIGFDLIFCVLETAIFIASDQGVLYSIGFVVLAAVVSPGVAFPLYLASRHLMY